MVARIQTNKLFQGKIYAKTKPNSCMNDISDSLDFDLVSIFKNRSNFNRFIKMFFNWNLLEINNFKSFTNTFITLLQVMPYNDLLCDVKQKEHGKFANDIVIQHHDMIVSI